MLNPDTCLGEVIYGLHLCFVLISILLPTSRLNLRCGISSGTGPYRTSRPREGRTTVSLHTTSRRIQELMDVNYNATRMLTPYPALNRSRTCSKPEPSSQTLRLCI